MNLIRCPTITLTNGSSLVKYFLFVLSIEIIEVSSPKLQLLRFIRMGGICIKQRFMQIAHNEVFYQTATTRTQIATILVIRK